MAQTLTEIRAMLEAASLRPQKMFGQNFLIDHNLLDAIVDLSGVIAGDAVLEIGPGTGALTDMLLATGAKVLAVEIDDGMARLLGRRYEGQDDFRLVHADVLAGKHRVNDKVLAEAATWGAGKLHIVGNLPYNIATSLVCEFLMLATAAARGEQPGLACRDITITVQNEVAERLAAGVGEDAYGAASVLVAVLGKAHMGRKLPATAFWPRPKVTSRMLRIDIRGAVEAISDIQAFRTLLAGAFAQRRKKIGSLAKRGGAGVDESTWSAAMEAAGVNPNVRPERITPEQFARMAARIGNES